MADRASQVERDGVLYRVEGSPLLPLSFHALFHSKRLTRPSGDVRAVVPGVPGWGLAVFFAVAAAGASRVGWGLLGAGNPGRAAEVVGILGAVFAVVFGLAALIILTDRTRFDRATGRASRRRLGRALWSVDLREILAVQCLYVGEQWTKSGSVRQYQINLVLRAAGDRRVHVCGDWDPAWVRALGRDLAEFLEIPMVDQT